MSIACAHVPDLPPAPEPGVPVEASAVLSRIGFVLGCPPSRVSAESWSDEGLASGCGRLAAFTIRDDGTWALEGQTVIQGSGISVPYRPAMTKPVPNDGGRALGSATIRELIHTSLKGGEFIVDCEISQEGRVLTCRPKQSVRGADALIMGVLYRTRYQPATYQGRPIATVYEFRIRFYFPHR